MRQIHCVLLGSMLLTCALPGGLSAGGSVWSGTTTAIIIDDTAYTLDGDPYPVLHFAKASEDFKPRHYEIPLITSGLIKQFGLHWTIVDKSFVGVSILGQINFALHVFPLQDLTFLPTRKGSPPGQKSPQERQAARSALRRFHDERIPIEPLADAGSVRAILGRKISIYFDCCVQDDRAITLYLLFGDRISVWCFQYDRKAASSGPSTGRRGRPLRADSRWERIATFAAPFQGHFTAYHHKDRVFLLTQAGALYRCKRFVMTDQASAAGEPLIVEGERDTWEDISVIFGTPDPAITLEKVQGTGRIEKVLVDRDRDNIFWISDDKISDSSVPPVSHTYDPVSTRPATPASETHLSQYLGYLPLLKDFDE
jgi:hypothetical protein